jgi:tetratricopeptide (TPR) repeat protein
MIRLTLSFVFLAGLATAGAACDAQKLYHRTDYRAALDCVLAVPAKGGAEWALAGKSYFGLGEYRKATEVFEKAVELDPRNSIYVHWLGKSWGRRAELANPIMAAAYATKTRQYFERAVLLDSRNREALGDLFEYCLEAPGFMGGGLSRAEELARRIAANDEAEGHYARALIADRRKDVATAEGQLRRAMELAPLQVGRAIDLAKYLAKLGRVQESEAVFAQAEKIAPHNPRILYERADTYIRTGRNLDQARNLLNQYLQLPVTSDDPPKSKAEELLRKAGA